mgnify:CR=1 FL=1
MLGLLAILLAAGGCQPEAEPDHCGGYLEAEYVYVSSPRSGELKRLDVARGNAVTNGQSLFALDPEPEATALAEVDGKLVAARARLQDLRTGARPSELAALEARLTQVRVALQLAETEFNRISGLRASKVSSEEALDRARATRDGGRAQIAELEANLTTARLGGRPDAIAAAEAEVIATEAAHKQARWNCDQKTLLTPVTAAVEDTYFQPGEWVPAGRPVVALLPPGNVKARFFIPERRLTEFPPGCKVEVRWDGGRPVIGKVSYVSRQAEFTPPVIYSRESRTKLVFMAEAVFSETDRIGLRVGQPLEVRLKDRPPTVPKDR